MPENKTKVTTVRIKETLWSDLDIMRSALQNQRGSLFTMNELINTILQSQVDDERQANPGAFDRRRMEIVTLQVAER